MHDRIDITTTTELTRCAEVSSAFFRLYVPPHRAPLRILLRACLIVFPLFSLTAQQKEKPPIVLGIETGYERGNAFGEFPVFDGSAGCGLFSDGLSERLRIAGSIRFPRFPGGNVGTALGLGWSRSFERFTALPLDPQRIYDPEENAVVELEREFRFLSSFSTLQLEVLGTIALGDHVELAVGPAFSYQFGEEFGQYDYLLGPPSRLFEDGSVEREMTGGTSFSIRPFGFGGVVRGEYRLPAGQRLQIVPGLSLRLDLLGPVAELQRSTLSGGFHLSLRYAFPPSEPPATPPLAENEGNDNGLPNDTARTFPPPSATLDIFSVDQHLQRSDSARILTGEIREEVIVTLPTTLEFNPGEESLSGRYRLLSAERVGTFSVDSIQGNVESVRRELLNIIGERLRNNPTALLNIEAGVPVGGDPELLRRRIANVVDYLHDVWSVEPDRISVKERGKEQQEISIRLSPEQMKAPLIVQRITRRFHPPTIRIAPRITAEAGLASWSITISQGEKIVARYSDAADPEDIAWDAIAGGDTAGKETPLIAVLNVVDSSGTRTSAQDTMIVRFVRNPVEKGNRRILVIPIPTDREEGERLFREALLRGISNMTTIGQVSLLLPDSREGEFPLTQRKIREITEETFGTAGMLPEGISVATGADAGTLEVVLDPDVQ